MTTDYRALCAELIDALDSGIPAGRIRLSPLADRARAALADGPAVPEGREPASVAKQPSDRELLELMSETMRDEFAYAAKVCSEATGGQVKPRIFRVCLNTAALEYARAVLNRWGTPNLAEIRSSLGGGTQPVPVSERLPGPEDCDGEGKVWAIAYLNAWMRVHHSMISRWKAWLPANALPLPQVAELEGVTSQ